MGFDNECILNIQGLPGEYFCPVCRTLVYPNEALQSQCTHLYCKPCLAYIVATTHACPYDGYLVTEADSKPLTDSNKPIAEAIGKLAVYCLYHRSGCQWQGTLTECITHCTTCSFGDSPVVCNRCGTQIIHRQVQEHAQTCPGLQPHAQQTDGLSQSAATLTPAVAQDSTAATTSTATPAATVAAPTAATATAATGVIPTSTPAKTAASAAPASVPAAVATTAASSQSQIQPGALAPTPEQLYQQQQLQYQQYYQQYPGYDPYQQQYSQYPQYQQQAYPQYAQSQTQVAQQQPVPYVQVQQQTQPHVQPQNQTPLQPQHQQQTAPPLQQYASAQAVQQQPTPQNLPYPQSQPHLQAQPHTTNQVVQMPVQRPPVPSQQPYQQARPQTLPVSQTQAVGQQFVQPVAQPHLQPHPQMQPQPQVQAPPPQQPLQPQQHPPTQLQNQQSVPQQHQHLQQQSQPISQHQVQQNLQPQAYPQSQPQQPLPNMQLQHQYPAHAVTGHQSFPQPQMVQQTLPQRPMHPQQQGVPYQHPQQPGQVQSQFPHQQPQLRPPQGQVPMQAQPQTMLPPQGTHNLHPMPPHQLPGMPPQSSQLPHQMPQPPHQVRGYLHPGQPQPQGLPTQQQMHHQGPTPIPQPMHGQHYQQQIHQPQNVGSRPVMGNHALHQEVPPKFLQPSPSQQATGQSNFSRLATATLENKIPATGGPKSDMDDKAGRGSEIESGMLRKDAARSQKDIYNGAFTEHSAAANLNAPDGKAETNSEKFVLETKKEEHDATLAKIKSEGSEHHAKHEGMEDPNYKQGFKERVAGTAEEKGEPSNVSKNVFGDGETHNGVGHNKPVERVEEESSQGHIDTAANKQVPQTMHQEVPSFERAAQPPYHDRIPPVVAGKERYPQVAHEHPSHLSGATQRPPAPEQLFPKQMSNTGLNDRRFHDSSHQVQSHGQAVGPGATVRTPGPGMPEPLATHGPPPSYEHHHPPRPNFPYGPYPSEGSNAVFPPAGPPANRPPAHGATQTRPSGPPYGSFDSPMRPMARGPFGPLDQVGTSHGHGYFDGKQPDPRATQLSMMSANGIPSKDQLNGIRDSTLVHGDSSRHTGFRREFDEDLKHFHRPTHLDGEGVPKYDSYFSSRHGDKGMPQFADARPFEGGFTGPDGVPPFPSRKIDPFGAGSASGERHLVDRLNRDRPMGFSEEFPSNHDTLRRPPEYNNRHMDAPPSIGSPVGYGFSNRSGMDDFDPRESRSGKNFMPYSLGPVKLPGNGRPGFGRNYPMPDFAEPGHFSAVPFNGEMDPFDSKRRTATRCLLCKIDCESLEGLEMHSQTMDHQKMAMDIIMDIKRESAKKQRTSKDNISLKEPNKFRKTGFEKRGNRH